MYPTTNQNSENTSKDIINNDISFENGEEKPVESQGSIQNNIDITPSTMGHKINVTTCCSFVKKGIEKFRLLNWYLAPITYDIGFSFSCLFYHYLNFCFAFCMFILLGVGLGVFVPFIILCIGIPLLYFLFEITILLTRFNHLYNYYLVENNKLLLTNEKWKIKLKLDNKNIPLCSVFCISGSRLNRIRFIITSYDFYLTIIYHLFINSFCSIIFGLCSIPLLYLLYLFTYIIRYPFQPQWFKNNHECLFGDTNCGSLPCKCSGWSIDNFGNVFSVFLISLILLPFGCYLNNYAAKLSKSINYYILTDYYKYKNNSDYNPNQTLISSNNKNDSNQTIEINDSVKTNDGTELETIARNTDDINDLGVNDIDL